MTLSVKEKEEIRLYWRQGFTSGEIARSLSISRSTVMGFVSRNQIKRDADPLPPPAKIEVPEPPKQETKKSRELKGRRIKLVVKPKMFRNYSVTITDSPDEIKPNTLLALKSDSCRFIIGEVAGEDTIYCCGPRQKNYYCSQHAALCYEKPRKKYRRRAGTAPLLGRSAYFVKSF